MTKGPSSRLFLREPDCSVMPLLMGLHMGAGAVLSMVKNQIWLGRKNIKNKRFLVRNGGV